MFFIEYLLFQFLILLYLCLGILIHGRSGCGNNCIVDHFIKNKIALKEKTIFVINLDEAKINKRWYDKWQEFTEAIFIWLKSFSYI